MKTITDKSQFPKDAIIGFMNSLDNEKKYFLYSVEEVLESEVLIYEEQNLRIIGMAGIRFLPGFFGKLLKLPIAYVVVHRDFQGQSIGSQLFAERSRVAKQRYNYMLSTVAKDNRKMLNLSNKLPYKILGETNERYYSIEPHNAKGVAMYYLIKAGLSFHMLFLKTKSNLTRLSPA